MVPPLRLAPSWFGWFLLAGWRAGPRASRCCRRHRQRRLRRPRPGCRPQSERVEMTLRASSVAGTCQTRRRDLFFCLVIGSSERVSVTRVPNPCAKQLCARACVCARALGSERVRAALGSDGARERERFLAIPNNSNTHFVLSHAGRRGAWRPRTTLATTLGMAPRAQSPVSTHDAGGPFLLGRLRFSFFF